MARLVVVDFEGGVGASEGVHLKAVVLPAAEKDTLRDEIILSLWRHSVIQL